GDKDHVDVGNVVELSRTGLAHADDGESRRGNLVGRESDIDPGNRERRVEGCAGKIGEGLGDAIKRKERLGVPEIPRGELREVASVAHTEGDPRRLTRESTNSRDDVFR